MPKPGALAGVNVLDLSRLLPGPYCSITGYGQDGPFRDRVGHDANYLSKAGVLGVPEYAELQYNEQRRKEIIDYMRKTSKTLGAPVKLSESPGAVRTPPVDFGASTPDILRELGYSENEIERFEAEGVV